MKAINQQINQQLTTNKNNRTKENIYSENSHVVLAYLNKKTGKRFRDASFIEARLRDGGAVDECRRIIDTKLEDPYFKENPKYLNPKTLFRQSHWDQYLNETIPQAAETSSGWFKNTEGAHG